MKKNLYLLMILAGLLFAGCAQLNTVFKFVDSITAPVSEIVHQGEVKSIQFNMNGYKIVSFVDGASYEVVGSVYVSPGDQADIVETKKGYEVK